jgi:hypothetical protein
MKMPTHRLSRLLILGVLLLTSVFPKTVAHGTDPTCGVSDGHTLCLSVPAGALSGKVTITIAIDPNDGLVIARWLPRRGTSTHLITRFTSSPETNDYSFVWPTQKYLDASGTLRVQHGSILSAAVDAAITLSNGNTTDFRHSRNDWRAYLPGGWTATTDPVVAAVGDGPSGEATSNVMAQSIAAADPALFLFLGDVYEEGTFVENLNYYGASALHNPAGATLWGATARITQPTVGNHEARNMVAWKDYWHGHPAHMSFTFGGVLFLDLNATESFAVGSKQFSLVKKALSSAPSCVVAFWHHPILWKDEVDTGRQPMWSLLANKGGDLVLNGHKHSMAVYQPLDAHLELGGHMVEIVSGAGGHKVAGAGSDSSGRLLWAQGKTAGVLYLTLNGANSGGTATSISWTFEDVSGNPLSGSAGSVDC